MTFTTCDSDGAAKHPRAIAASLSHSPKLAARESGYAVTKNEIREIRALQVARREARAGRIEELCERARASRPFRTPAARAKAAAASAAFRAEIEAKRAAAAKAEARAKAVRQTLYAAARIARSMDGWRELDRSKDRDDRLSSYYFRAPAGRMVRISDHRLPWSEKRDFMARQHGRDGFDGFHGGELIIDGPRSATWLRRKLILIAAGRN